MWRKSDSEPEPPAPSPSRPSSSGPGPSRRGNERAIIGPSITIHGDVTGEEDLVIQGKVDGKVDLKQHNVTIGKDGRVKADIFGRLIQVEGEVDGNLFGDEQVVVRQSGQVEGNITAPRVTLEDGCRFKGSINMEPKGAGKGTGRSGLSSPPPTTGSGRSEPTKTEPAKSAPAKSGDPKSGNKDKGEKD